MTTKKIGFACIWSELHPKKGVISTEGLNVGGTTITYLDKQPVAQAEQKLYDIMVKNITAIGKLVEKVSEQEPALRMVRLSSDVMTGYTHERWSYFYKRGDIQRKMEELFAPIGEMARARNVRLSFHPGQFCCIVSENEGIVKNSLAELEYHTDMMRWMGYGNKLLEAKINVHLSGNRGVSGFESAWNRMSPELRNMLTIENDEFKSGLDILLQLKHKVGIVLDLHHHWINTGEYIEANDSRIKEIIESWCRDGVDRRPTFHYSQSHENVLGEHPRDTVPSISSLIQTGHKKAKLRAHSNSMWNTATNMWARQHWDWGDCMVEAKMKNLASASLFKQWTNA